MLSGPFVAMQAILPPKPIQVKPGSASASASSAAAAAPAAAGGSGQYPPATPLQTPPYSALRTPRTPALLDAFGKGDSTITHFAPADTKGIADHTLKTLGLAFNMYETYLGCKFPHKALQTVSCSSCSLLHLFSNLYTCTCYIEVTCNQYVYVMHGRFAEAARIHCPSTVTSQHSHIQSVTVCPAWQVQKGSKNSLLQHSNHFCVICACIHQMWITGTNVYVYVHDLAASSSPAMLHKNLVLAAHHTFAIHARLCSLAAICFLNMSYCNHCSNCSNSLSQYELCIDTSRLVLHFSAAGMED